MVVSILCKRKLVNKKGMIIVNVFVTPGQQLDNDSICLDEELSQLCKTNNY